MLRNIEKLLDIQKYEYPYIYTKQNEKKVMIEIMNIYNEDKEAVFNNLIKSADMAMDFYCLKEHQKIDDYLVYFNEILDRNINQKFLYLVAKYITSLKEKILTLNKYSLYIIFFFNTSQGEFFSIKSILDKLKIEYRILNENDIKKVLSNAFSD